MIGCVALIGLESLTKRGMPALEKYWGLIEHQCKSDEKLVSRICRGWAGSPVPGRHQSAETADRHSPENHQKADFPGKKAHRREVNRRGERRQIWSPQREKRNRQRAERQKRANPALQH